MKKILLSALFMSTVSMAIFAADPQLQQMNEVTFFGARFPGGLRLLQNIPMNILEHETVADFIDHLRNTIDPDSDRPYVEGNIVWITRNQVDDLPLDSDIADLDIQPEDFFLIRYEAYPVVNLLAEEDDADDQD